MNKHVYTKVALIILIIGIGLSGTLNIHYKKMLNNINIQRSLNVSPSGVLLWGNWNQIHEDITLALSQLDKGDTTRAIQTLYGVKALLVFMGTIVYHYKSVLLSNNQGSNFGIDHLDGLYEGILGQIIEELNTNETPTHAIETLKLLNMDIQILMDVFSQETLQEGNLEILNRNLELFCTRMQLIQVREWVFPVSDSPPSTCH